MSVSVAPRLLIALLAAFWAAADVTPAAAADARAIEDFLKLKPKWGTFADVKLQFRVEGRYSSISRNALRFRKASLLFRAADGTELPKPAGDTATVEVWGYLVRDGERFEFVVERLRERPDDLETLQVREAKLPGGQPEAWYELAGWAAGRAAFYEDDALRGEAERLYLKGMQIERRDDPESAERLLALAGKAARFKLPLAVQQQFVHDAYWLLWNDVDRTDADELRELGEQMARALPGAKLPLKSLDDGVRKAYLERPQERYAAASAATRGEFHRLLYSELMRARILLDAAADGRNGSAIAERLERELPEWKSLAASFRDKELDYRLSKIGTLTKDEMLALRDAFVERERPDEGRTTVETWLGIRAERLRDDDLAGRIHLADEYVQLLDDRRRASELLIAAYERNPESEDAAAALRRLGFRLDGERWMSRKEFEARPVDPVQRAIREGRVTRGMTRVQVRKTLGVPTAVTRVASARQINEVWVFQQPGGSRLAVHFLRSIRAGAEAKVVEVSPVSVR